MADQPAIDFEVFDVGYDIPAAIGMDIADIQTPCLILDLDALERNITKMGKLISDMGVRHRIHGKMHKSVDVALLQERLGGSCGVACRGVSDKALCRLRAECILSHGAKYEFRDHRHIFQKWLSFFLKFLPKAGVGVVLRVPLIVAFI